MTANTTYYLSQMDTNVTSSSATLPVSVDTASFSADAVAEQAISLDILRNLFQFHSDATDVTDVAATDLLFKFVYTSGDLGVDLGATTITSGSVDTTPSSQIIAHDYVRYLALNLFGTTLGADLFSNEAPLRADLQSTFSTNFAAVLTNLNAAAPVDTTGSSLVLDMFKQMIGNNPERFADITPYSTSFTDPSGNAYYSLPIQAGDVIVFKITISAASGQESLTGGSVSIPDRTYLLRMIATAP